MAQFDVFRERGIYPLVVDIQTDTLAQLESRVVLPLIQVARYPTKPVKRLNPVVHFLGTDYVLLVQLASAVATQSLGQSVGSIASHRADIIAALDLLFTGS